MHIISPHSWICVCCLVCEFLQELTSEKVSKYVPVVELRTSRHFSAPILKQQNPLNPFRVEDFTGCEIKISSPLSCLSGAGFSGGRNLKAVTVKVISRGSLETICFCSVRALTVPLDLGVTTLLVVGRTTATISVGSLDPAFTSELFSNPCQLQGHDIIMVSACQI